MALDLEKEKWVRVHSKKLEKRFVTKYYHEFLKFCYEEYENNQHKYNIYWE